MVIWGLRILTIIVLWWLWIVLLAHELTRRIWEELERGERRAYG